MSSTPPVVHRNLLWLTGAPETLDVVLADPHLRELVVARPAPGLAAVAPADRARVEARLARLGQAARLERGA
jgi:hypothetical protein